MVFKVAMYSALTLWSFLCFCKFKGGFVTAGENSTNKPALSLITIAITIIIIIIIIVRISIAPYL